MSLDYYNDIPASLLKNKVIFEVGSGTGKNQLLSKHKEIFEKASLVNNYLGIDKYLTSRPLLNILEYDIREFLFYPNAVDTILMMHCLEHIEIKDWKRVLDKLISYLRPRGWLVIACPYDENINSKRDPDHVVFHITIKTLRKYLPKIKMFKANINYSRKFGIKIGIWWLRQFLMGVRFLPFNILRYSFIAFWKKENGE